jgi:hypothetical protein
VSATKSEKAFHRKAMAHAFNDAWDLLEKPRRSREDDRQMLDLAHAARHHASRFGTSRNRAIGDWQVSRAYAAAGDGRWALEYARSCLETCESSGLSDLLGTAYEAMARAHAVARRSKPALSFLARARRELDRSELDADDRAIYLGQIRDTERMVRRSPKTTNRS